MLTDALVYLAAAVLCVPLAKRLGLGAVLGYLIAGVAIGPWGLRLVDDVESILHFSEFGVVLMLFVIGLELEAQRLWAMRGRCSAAVRCNWRSPARRWRRVALPWGCRCRRRSSPDWRSRFRRRPSPCSR